MAKQEQLTFKAETALREWLDDAAKAKRRTRADLIRLILEDWLNAHHPR